jgi:hypothetical protein
MQNNHTQPPNIIRKTRICYVQLATIRTFQKVSLCKINRNPALFYLLLIKLLLLQLKKRWGAGIAFYENTADLTREAKQHSRLVKIKAGDGDPF